jgi:integrase
MRALTKAEVSRLLEATGEDPFGPLFALAIGSGVRLGEILAL